MLPPEQFFKCLSDATRLRCITLLQKQGKLCVCELTAALDLSQPKISRHLALLRQCGLLLDKREGQWVFYHINPELPAWAHAILDNAVTAVTNDEQFKVDLERLNNMTGRPETSVCC